MLNQDDLYPTRGDHEFLSERKDPIVYGSDTHPKHLLDEEMRNYEKNGFVILPNIFSLKEVASINHQWRQLKQRQDRGKQRMWMQSIPLGEQESLFAPEKANPVFDNLACDPRILVRVRQILGSAVHLHRSRVHVKNGLNGSYYPWHSEFETWHAEDGVPRMRGVEAWLMLTESTPGNSALRMLAKSHLIYVACKGAKQGNGPDGQPCARPSVETLTRLLYFGALSEACGAPGTLVLCDSNLMYGSAKGSSSKKQATLMLSYNSVENIPAERPFAGERFRPEPLVNHDMKALKPKPFELNGYP